ncbi:MAG: hypothetical protein HOW73_36965 [Polyangiaceae bacterium]|nr:hypothetical protein [Polyangiaceae bacterium]
MFLETTEASPWREELATLLSRRFGHDPNALLVARVQEAVMGIAIHCGVQDPAAFLADLASLPLEAPLVQALIELATIKESYFFRDEPAMNTLRGEILPQLIQARRSSRTLRIWSAGCSNGEEIYSVAILVKELLRDEEPGWSLSFVATDVDAKALAVARTAEYGSWSMRATSEADRQRYFETVAGPRQHRLRATFRKGVTFELHNLAEEGAAPPAGAPFDLILCRNVSIYFNGSARETLRRNLLSALAADGVWVTGPSDPLPESGAKIRIRAGLVAISPPAPIVVPVEREAPAAAVFALPAKPPIHRPSTRNVAPHNGIFQPVGGKSPVAPRPPRPPKRMEEARALADRGDVRSAFAVVTALIDDGDVSAEPYALRAIMHEANGDDARAAEDYRRAIYLEPNLIDAHVRLGLLVGRAGRTDEAIRHLRNAVAIGARSGVNLKSHDEVRVWTAAAQQLSLLLSEKR